MDFRSAIDVGIRKATCAWVSSGDPFRNYIAGITSSVPGISAGFEGFDSFADGIQALACPADGGSGTVTPPTFPPETGNCPNVQYDVVVRVEAINYDGSNGGEGQVYQFDAISAPNTRTGPIGPLVLPGPRVGGLSDRQTPPIAILEGPDQTPSNLRKNSRFDGLNLNDGDNQVVREVSRTVTRVDGQPDDCPPPGGGVPLPVTPPRVQDDVTYDTPDGPVTIPVGFTFLRPELNINGELNIPITINGPTFSFGVNFNISGDAIVIIPGAGGGEDASCCCPEEEDGEEDEEPDGERRLIHVEVVSIVSPLASKLTEVFNNNGPDMYWPDLGHLVYQIKVGDRTTYLNPIKVQLKDVAIPVPEGMYAVNYSFVPRVGVQATLRPVYANIPLTQG